MPLWAIFRHCDAQRRNSPNSGLNAGAACETCAPLGAIPNIEPSVQSLNYNVYEMITKLQKRTRNLRRRNEIDALGIRCFAQGALFAAAHAVAPLGLLSPERPKCKGPANARIARWIAPPTNTILVACLPRLPVRACASITMSYRIFELTTTYQPRQFVPGDRQISIDDSPDGQERVFAAGTGTKRGQLRALIMMAAFSPS